MVGMVFVKSRSNSIRDVSENVCRGMELLNGGGLELDA